MNMLCNSATRDNRRYDDEEYAGTCFCVDRVEDEHGVYYIFVTAGHLIPYEESLYANVNIISHDYDGHTNIFVESTMRNEDGYKMNGMLPVAFMRRHSDCDIAILFLRDCNFVCDIEKYAVGNFDDNDKSLIVRGTQFYKRENGKQGFNYDCREIAVDYGDDTFIFLNENLDGGWSGSPAVKLNQPHHVAVGLIVKAIPQPVEVSECSTILKFPANFTDWIEKEKNKFQSQSVVVEFGDRDGYGGSERVLGRMSFPPQLVKIKFFDANGKSFKPWSNCPVNGLPHEWRHDRFKDGDGIYYGTDRNNNVYRYNPESECRNCGEKFHFEE